MRKSIISAVLAVTVFLGVGGSLAVSTVNAQSITIQQLVQLFITLGIIPADKAQAAEAAVGLPTTGTVSNWTTYTSSQYGFSFQYPASFGTPITGNDGSLSLGPNGITVYMPRILMNNAGQPKTFNDLMNDYSVNGYNETTITVGGIKSLEISSSQIGTEVFVPLSGNQMLEVLGSNNDPVFNQMLSTFQFSQTTSTQSALTISSLSPTSGPTGTQVTINGSGFTSPSYVLIDGMVASEKISSSNSNSITFTVPNNLYPQCHLFNNGGNTACAQFIARLSSGNHSVSVITSNGTSNALSFNVTSSSITPVSSSATAVITGQPTLALTYDSSNKESALTATFNVNVTAGNSGLNLVTSIAGIGFMNQNNANYSYNQSQTSVNVAQGEKTDPYGRDYTLISAGQTLPVTVVMTVSPKQMFAGNYHAVLSALYGDDTQGNLSNLNISSGQTNTNSVTIVGETSPYISSISPTTVAPGGTITALGQRLANTTVLIDGVVAPLGSQYSTNFPFILPSSVLLGNHTLQLVGNDGQKSNLVGFTVSGGTNPVSSNSTATITGQPTLALTYDSSNKESALTATFNVTFTSGNNPAQIYFNGSQIRASDGNSSHDMIVMGSLVPSQTLANDGSNYTVPANTTVTFTATGHFSPRIMFAGSYSASITTFYTGGLSLNPIQSINANKTNTVTIVGETSPYITSVSPNTVAVGQKVSINGQRLFDGSHFAGIFVDNSQITMMTDGSKDGTLLLFTLPSLSAGNHQLQVENWDSQKSNVVGFTVSGGTTVDPTITVTYPQTGYSLDDSGAKGNGNSPIATIQWTEQNGNLPVTINLYNQYNQIVKTIASNVSNTGSYVWAYDPTLTNGTYILKLLINNGNESAWSGYFTIGNSPASQTTPTVTTTPLTASCSAYNNGGIAWTAQVSGGTSPYSYSWSAYNDVSAYTTGSTVSATFGATYSTPGTKSAVVNITDASGNKTSANCSASLVGSANQAQQSITVTSPNGGESLIDGTNYTISWTSSGLTSSDYIHIMLTDPSGADKGYIAQWLPGTQTSYSWKAGGFFPSIDGGNYKVKVYTSTGSASDLSDNAFTVNAAASSTNGASAMIGIDAILRLINIMK